MRTWPWISGRNQPRPPRKVRSGALTLRMLQLGAKVSMGPIAERIAMSARTSAGDLTGPRRLWLRNSQCARTRRGVAVLYASCKTDFPQPDFRREKNGADALKESTPNRDDCRSPVQRLLYATTLFAAGSRNRHVHGSREMIGASIAAISPLEKRWFQSSATSVANRRARSRSS